MIFNHIHFVFKQAETTNQNSIYFFIVRQTCRYYVKKGFHHLPSHLFSRLFQPKESSRKILQKVASEARSLLGSITGSLPPIPKPWEIAESYGINLASAVAKKCHGRGCYRCYTLVRGTQGTIGCLASLDIISIQFWGGLVYPTFV